MKVEKVKEMIKYYQEEINYNVKQKMWHRNRIHDKCISIAHEDKKEMDIGFLEEFINKNNIMIEALERHNDLLNAKITTLKELINEEKVE